VSETPLEMEERHIVQLERMISKQELRLSELERTGYADAAERARDLLASTRSILQLAWKRRERLLRLWVCQL